MTYEKDGSLNTTVVDIPLGKGVDEGTQKHLFQPPFMKEAKNVEINKEGSVQKRDGIEFVASAPINIKKPTVFANPGGQLGVVGGPTYQESSTSANCVAIEAVGETGSAVPSNTTGVYPCNILEDPVTRSDDAILHVQSCVYGNYVITVWCVQKNAVTDSQKANADWVYENRTYYMVRELDTKTVVKQPTEIEWVGRGGTPQPISYQPRYTHIYPINNHWVVVVAPDLNPYGGNATIIDPGWNVQAVSIDTGTRNIAFGPSEVIVKDLAAQVITANRFVAVDMHAVEDGSATEAFLIMQSNNLPTLTHLDYMVRIDEQLVMPRDVATNDAVELTGYESPEYSGAVYHVPGDGVYTAVSNRYDAAAPILNAVDGDGQVWFHKYNETTLAKVSSRLMFAYEQPVGTVGIGITKACTRLTIGQKPLTGQFIVYGSQFWNPAGYMGWETVDHSSSPLWKRIRDNEYLMGSKGITRMLWADVPTNEQDSVEEQHQSTSFLVTKAFLPESGVGTVEYPMVGVSATNGSPSTYQGVDQLSNKSTEFLVYGQGGGTSDIITSVSHDQPSKHPMGLIVAPHTVSGVDQLLRPVARFGADSLVECEDVFPLKWGRDPGVYYSGGSTGPTENFVARWHAPALQSVWRTQTSGEMHFCYKSRLIAGVERKVGYDRWLAYGFDDYSQAVAGHGSYFSEAPDGAYGGEDVFLQVNNKDISVTKDSSSSYFSGGYLGFFDGMYNGESDAHSSPGTPYGKIITTNSVFPSYQFPQNGLENPDAVFSGSNQSVGQFYVGSAYEFLLCYTITDEDGNVHRSAPSEPITITSDTTQRQIAADSNAVAVVRYMMPPPSAFSVGYKPDPTLGSGNMRRYGVAQKTLHIEVYARYTPDDENTPAVTNFVLVDRFIPEETRDIGIYRNLQSATTHLTGSHVSPFITSNVVQTRLRSGFPFYGERLIFKGPHTLNNGKQGQYFVDGDFTDKQLYTTGGVIQNDPPPAMLDTVVANKRMWGIPGNDRSQVWFSKILQKGTGPEWSAAFTMRVPRGAASLTAIGELDGKVLLFSGNDIFVVVGDGPNNLGRGGSLTGPTKVASDVGCIERRSVVSGPFGVMFQSSAGIYLVGRDLSVSFVGKQIEDTVSGGTKVTGAVLYEAKNQVWFTVEMPSGQGWKAAIYDYEHGAWFVFESTAMDSITSATLFNSRFTAVVANGLVAQSVPFSIGDGAKASAVAFESKVITAWIKMAGIQGFQRARRVFVLGERVQGRVRLGVQYNYDETVTTQKEWLSSEFVGGGGTLPNDPMQVGIHIPRQKCQSVRFIIDDFEDPQTGDPANAGILISSISLRVGVKAGLFKTSEGSKK